MSEPEVTLGEVHRLLTRVDGELKSHRVESRDALVRIDAHLGTLNSKTASHAVAIASHAARLDAHDRELRDIKKPSEVPALPKDLVGELHEGLELVKDFKGAVRTWRRLFWLFGFVAAAVALWQLAKRAGVSP